MEKEKALHGMVSEALYEKYKAFAEKRQLTVAGLVRLAVANHVEREEKKEKGE